MSEFTKIFGDLETEIETSVELGMINNAVRDVAGHPVGIVPSGTMVVDLEQYLQVPLSMRASVSTQDAASFVRYVNEHKRGSTRIFATVTADGGAFNQPKKQAALNGRDFHPPI